MTSEERTISDSVKLVVFVDRCIRAERLIPLLYFTRRLFNMLTFGRLGLPAKSWKRLDPNDAETDHKLLCDVLWKNLFQALPDIADLYNSELEFYEEPKKVEGETVQPELSEPVYQPPVLLLPAPSRPEFIPEPEPEIIEAEPLPVIDIEAREAEAEEAANQVLSVFQGDHPDWEDPEALLEELEATLIAVSPFHPAKLKLLDRLSFVRECFYFLEEFNHEFDQVMSTPLEPDEQWGISWLAQASADLHEQAEMPSLKNLKRASLPHYLLGKWNARINQEEIASDSSAEESSQLLHVDTSENNTFREPASELDSCF